MQTQQPLQPITQNFQITPTQNNSELEGKYANNIDEVKNTFVLKTGIFTNKDFSIVWIKDVTGNIRTFKTEELIELDPKDYTVQVSIEYGIKDCIIFVGNVSDVEKYYSAMDIFVFPSVLELQKQIEEMKIAMSNNREQSIVVSDLPKNEKKTK